jgi:3-hydroxyisobutyrate dehydrogenase-like beta-hydroxyacid dehydrogenase
MEKVGFVGLGIMGKPMAKNLLKAGFDLTFYARRPEVIAEMEEAGATAADSSKAVAEQTDIIVTIVTADLEVREVVLGEAGVLEGASAGKLIVDMSTISPLTIQEVAAEAAKKQVRVVDAPVSGGDVGAIAGTLTIIAGGAGEDIESCRPLFAAMGNKENIFHVGPLGVGQTVKIVNQVIGGVNMAMIAEGLCMGIKAGADPEIMRQVISVSSGNSTLFQMRVADFLLKDQFTPGFMLDLMKKDVGLAVGLGKEMNVPMPISAVAYQMFALASSLGAGSEDFSAVCKAAEHLTGTRIGSRDE